MTYPETFKKRRKRLGCTQEALARYLGVNVLQIHKWEYGRMSRSLLYRRAYAAFMRGDYDAAIRAEQAREVGDVVPEEDGQPHDQTT